MLARSDIGNNDMRHQEAIYAIQELNPMMDQNQAKDLLEQHVFPKTYLDGKIKNKTLKVQATTMEQTAIAYQSQWRWYIFFTSMFNDLQRKNGGYATRPARHLDS